jgi:hypothetical protein
MSESHLQEIELAQLGSEGGADGISSDASEHLQWCKRCRSARAEYHWLGQKVAEALAATSDAVWVPRPQWSVVKGHLTVSRQRHLAGWRVSAIASVALAVCLILIVPFWAGATTAMQIPDAVVTPVVFVSVIPQDGANSVTPTPVITFQKEVEGTLTPVSVPTPPDLDA